MSWQTVDYDRIGGITDVRIADRAARELVGFTLANLQLIISARQTGVAQVQVFTVAANTEVISAAHPDSAGQHDAHAGVTRIGGPEIPWEEGGLLQRIDVLVQHAVADEQIARIGVFGKRIAR